MSKLRQVTAWKPGKYRGIDFSLDDIKAYVEGTNKAISAGIPVPLLKRHATIGANDSDTVAAANLDGAGWIKKLEVTDDGHIAWEAEDVPDEVKAGVEQGHLKFTSPEFRKSYSSEKEGIYTGPIIRHFAFTALPGNPHQGKITDPADPRINEQAAAIAMSEELKGISKARQAEMGCFQFDEEDLSSAVVPDPKAKGKFKKGTEDCDEDEDHDTNNDMGKGSKDGSIALDGADMDKEEGTEEGEGGSKRKKPSQPKQEEVSAHAEGDNPHVAGRFVGSKDELGPFEHHVKKHGGIVDEHGNFSVPKNKVKDMHKSLASGDFQHGEHYHLLGHGPDGSQHAEKPIQKEQNDNDEPPDPKALVEGTDIAEESAPPDTGEEAKNPDMPPKATDKSKTAAILAGLKRKGVVLPSDWSMEKEGAADLLLTGLNTAIEAENQAEMEEDDDDDEEESPPQDSAMPYSEAEVKKFNAQFDEHDHHGGAWTGLHKGKKEAQFEHLVHLHGGTSGKSMAGEGKGLFAVPAANAAKFHASAKVFGFNHGKHYSMHNAEHAPGKSQHNEAEQFSETELAALPPKARAAIEAGVKALAVERKAKEDAQKAQALAFAEEQKTKNAAARDKAKDVVSKAKIPPSLRLSLLSSYDTVQFSEGKEKPLYTASQVAEMVAKSIPPHLQFGEDDTEDASAPKVSKVIGKDPITGLPLSGEATEEQFFEADDIPTGHVSAARAEELVAKNPALGGFNRNAPRPGGTPIGIPDLVKAENARVPNNVRHGW